MDVCLASGTMIGMMQEIGRRLASILDPRAVSPGPSGALRSAPDASEVPAPSPLVDFLAYGDDSLVVGRIRLTRSRMTDLLNEGTVLELTDVVVERLSDGQAFELRDLPIARDELILVQAAGPRGDAALRQRTRAYPVAVTVGPYRVRGQLHAIPGEDPLAAIHHRPPMVPLTDAWVDRPEGGGAGEGEARRLGTVVLNRDRMRRFEVTWDDSSGWIDTPTTGAID